MVKGKIRCWVVPRENSRTAHANGKTWSEWLKGRPSKATVPWKITWPRGAKGEPLDNPWKAEMLGRVAQGVNSWPGSGHESKPWTHSLEGCPLDR